MNDAIGNLTFVNYPVSPDVTYQYDPLNRLTNMVDAVGTTKYTYTSGGGLFTGDGPFASDTVTNVYNNRLRIGLKLQQPTGVWTNGFGHDSARPPAGVTDRQRRESAIHGVPVCAGLVRLPEQLSCTWHGDGTGAGVSALAGSMNCGLVHDPQ